MFPALEEQGHRRIGIQDIGRCKAGAFAPAQAAGEVTSVPHKGQALQGKVRDHQDGQFEAQFRTIAESVFPGDGIGGDAHVDTVAVVAPVQVSGPADRLLSGKLGAAHTGPQARIAGKILDTGLPLPVEPGGSAQTLGLGLESHLERPAADQVGRSGPYLQPAVLHIHQGELGIHPALKDPVLGQLAVDATRKMQLLAAACELTQGGYKRPGAAGRGIGITDKRQRRGGIQKSGAETTGRGEGFIGAQVAGGDLCGGIRGQIGRMGTGIGRYHPPIREAAGRIGCLPP